MAGERIKVTSDELRQAIAKFNMCKEEMAQAYGQMSTEVMVLNGSWDGEASQAFMDRFTELVTNIRTSDETIEQAVESLEKAAQAYELAEEQNTAIGEGVPDAPPFA